METKQFFDKLKQSASVEEIEELFSKHNANIKDFVKDENIFSKDEIIALSSSSLVNKKIALLKKSKGTKTYYSPNYEFLNEEEKLMYEETIFLSKPWRKTEIFNTLYGGRK